MLAITRHYRAPGYLREANRGGFPAIMSWLHSYLVVNKGDWLVRPDNVSESLAVLRALTTLN